LSERSKQLALELHTTDAGFFVKAAELTQQHEHSARAFSLF
jgi:hypothetical protein